MRARLKMLGIGSLLILAACQTIPITSGQQTASVQSVPCPSLPEIVFRAPKTNSQVEALWLKNGLPDPKNAYDTPETVLEIKQFNAARAAVCGK